MKFFNRTGENLNRKKIKIISQTPEEIIADIERYDNPDNEGTKIDAETFNQFQLEIDTANTNANTAVDTANNANNKSNSAVEIANSANTKSQTALTKSEQAITDSTYAKNKSEEVEAKLADRGATVKVNGSTVTNIEFTSDPQTQIDNKITNSFEAIKTSILNFAYPIGSIYMSINATNPETLFGGTWERICGRFLLGADDNYVSGTTGGEATHVLTLNEMPSHSHNYEKSDYETNSTTLSIEQIPSHSHEVWTTDTWSTNSVGLKHSTKPFGVAGIDQSEGTEQWTSTETGDNHQIIRDNGGSQGHNHTINTIAAATTTDGLSQSHNNMPPYLAVYMWKRIG